MTQRWPNGRVVRDADGLELIVERAIVAPISEVWSWLTESTHLEKWIGSWEGEPGVGRTIQFTMTAEGATQPEPAEILICDPNVHFLADVGATPWRLGFTLAELAGTTVIFFTQRLANAADAGSIGPGWEFYLDRMICAREGLPLPPWEEYYPALEPYYSRVAASAS